MIFSSIRFDDKTMSMETSEPQLTAEEDLMASNLLLRTKLEVEYNIIVNDDLPFNLQEQNHLLRYLYEVEKVMANVTRGIVQDFAMGHYYFRTDEKW
jgi:hypothetical protein